MLKILTLLGAGILAFAAIAYWWLFTIPFSQTTLQKLTPGMSQAQVYAILGPANETNRLSRVETWWSYSHRPSAVHLIVILDSTGKYKSHVID
jgi:hypothetical protein